MTIKVKTLKLIADFLGFAFCFAISIIILVIIFVFIKVGGIIFYKTSIIISIIEFIVALFATIYFCHRVLRNDN